MAEGQDQNRSEAPTPFKLQKARERGSVARSQELGFLAGMVALAAFLIVAGEPLAQRLAQTMRTALARGFSRAAEPGHAVGVIGDVYWSALAPLALFGGTVMAIVVLLELIQLRGFIFTGQPLKPDFSRLNPAKGIKRLFSMRMVKETLKTILKTAAYAIAVYLVVRFAIGRYGEVAYDGERLPEAMLAVAMRLIFIFIGLAAAFAIIDQILVRGEFTKQMRMSRREVTKENREREGEPRIKQRRKALHGELVAQGKSTGALAGSDMLIVNPEHFAVALRYDEHSMTAPQVSAKGRNDHAQRLKTEAFRHGVPVVARPALARALHRACAIGATIPADRFEAVAELYIDLHRAAPAPHPGATP